MNSHTSKPYQQLLCSSPLAEYLHQIPRLAGMSIKARYDRMSVGNSSAHYLAQIASGQITKSHVVQPECIRSVLKQASRIQIVQRNRLIANILTVRSHCAGG